MGGTHPAHGADLGGGRHGFTSRPSTRAGWWALGLAVTFIGLMALNAVVFINEPDETSLRRLVLPVFGVTMLATGLASGVVALAAMIRSHERSWTVLVPLVVGMFVLVFLLGEFLVPH